MKTLSVLTAISALAYLCAPAFSLPLLDRGRAPFSNELGNLRRVAFHLYGDGATAKALETHLPKEALEQAFRSNFLLETGERYEECSAVLVSRRGYALTALHCVESCFERAGLMEAYRTRDSNEPYREFHRVKNQAPDNLRCGGSRGFRILASGPGRVVEFYEGDYSARDLEELEKFIIGDFVLIALDEIPPASSCMPVAQTPLAAGDPVWSVGYPSQTRREQDDSDGTQAFLTDGKVIGSVLEHPQAPSWEPATRSLLTNVYRRPEIMLSSLDLVDRMSGSMAFNSRGELAGLNTGSLVTHQNTEPFLPTIRVFIDNNARSLRIDHIAGEIKSLLGPERAAEIFDCR
jgi:hypothetical protein